MIAERWKFARAQSFETLFGLWQFVGWTSDPSVDGRQQEDAHYQGWNTVQYDFEGDSDLLFYLFSSAARPLRDDNNVIIRYVGICLDRKILEGNGSPDEQQDRDRQYKKAVVEA
jgi:hypothetical protein